LSVGERRHPYATRESQVDAEVVHVRRVQTRRLHGVAVEQHVVLATDLANRSDVLDADLVVYVHQ
jgi:hypothetical protein